MASGCGYGKISFVPFWLEILNFKEFSNWHVNLHFQTISQPQHI